MYMAAHPTSPLGKFFTRTEFAKIVGVSPWLLKRYQAEGFFLPNAPGGKGRGHVSLYHETQVEDFRKLPDRIEPHQIKHYSIYSQEEAQRVFQAIEEGKSLRWCVINIGVHPDVVEAAVARYAALDHGIFLADKIRTRINQCASLDGPIPIKGPEDVAILCEKAAERIEQLEGQVTEQNACPSCKRGKSRFCSGCVALTAKAVEEDAFQRGYAAAMAKVAAAPNAAGAPAEAKTPAGEPKPEKA